jgi:hypothetical protein
MSDGFEMVNDTADGEDAESESASIGRRRLFQMGAAGVAAVGTAAVANALTASPAGATPGDALVVGVDNTAGSGLTQLTGGNGFSVSTPLNGAGGGTTIAVEGSSSGSGTFGAIGVKGTGFAGVQGVSNGSNTLGTAGVQGIGSSWNPGVVASNSTFPTLQLAPSTGTATPTGGTAGNKKPFPGSFIVLSDGSLHYAPAAGQWQKLSSPAGFQQGNSCMLSSPIRVLDTRPGMSAAIHPGAPIAGGTSYGLQVTGESVGGVEVPAGAVGVIGNVTVVNTTGAGFLTLYPAGSPRPNASSINFTAGQVIANGVIIRLGSTGAMDIFASTTTDVIFDATGFIG